MDYQDLADLTGLNVRTLHNVGSGTVSHSARAVIEAALGIEIWSAPASSPASGAAPIPQESASSLHP